MAEVQQVLNQGTTDRKKANVYDGYDSEEWAIHDYELPFKISEYEDLEKLNDIATKFDSLDGSDIKKVTYLIDYQGCDMSEALEQYEDVVIYENMSYLELACELIDESWNVPEHLQNYIDYERFARELEFDYAQVGDDLFYSQS
jgi:antirestriction protein